MRARLYRGFNDGKVVEVRDDETYIVCVKPMSLGNLHSMAHGNPTMALATTKIVYRRTRHTHPDGSVFFEWDQPRRRR